MQVDSTIRGCAIDVSRDGVLPPSEVLCPLEVVIIDNSEAACDERELLHWGRERNCLTANRRNGASSVKPYSVIVCSISARSSAESRIVVFWRVEVMAQLYINSVFTQAVRLARDMR